MYPDSVGHCPGLTHVVGKHTLSSTRGNGNKFIFIKIVHDVFVSSVGASRHPTHDNSGRHIMVYTHNNDGGNVTLGGTVRIEK